MSFKMKWKWKERLGPIDCSSGCKFTELKGAFNCLLPCHAPLRDVIDRKSQPLALPISNFSISNPIATSAYPASELGGVLMHVFLKICFVFAREGPPL
jgi:hypothetical protein